MKELDVKKIKKINKSKYNAQFGVPVGGRGKLGADNIYVPATQVKAEPCKEEKTVEAAPEQKVVYEAKTEKMAVVVKTEDKKPVKAAKEKKPSLAKRTVNLFKPEYEGRVMSVNAATKGKKIPFGATVSVMFFMVLMMFVIINYVQIFENQTMINELKTSIEQTRETERKLSAELEQKYDLAQIGDYASSELGMVGSENNKKVYIDIGEEDSIEVYEPETEDFGTIATIMNALGDTVRAWIDVFE